MTETALFFSVVVRRTSSVLRPSCSSGLTSSARRELSSGETGLPLTAASAAPSTRPSSRRAPRSAPVQPAGRVTVAVYVPVPEALVRPGFARQSPSASTGSSRGVVPWGRVSATGGAQRGTAGGGGTAGSATSCDEPSLNCTAATEPGAPSTST